MNEYLYEMELSCEDNLLDEEIMYFTRNKMVLSNRKKRLQKENDIYGEESNYYFYC